MTNLLISLVANKIIISAAIACLVSQLVKFITAMFRNKKLDFYKLVETGGMPSAHAAVVSAITSAVYIEQGASALFAITLIISIIFLRDAIGLRMTVKKQSKILKKITPKASGLSESEGHKIPEVIMGIALGIIITLLIY